MKNHRFLIAAALMLFAAGCSKPDSPTTKPGTDKPEPETPVSPAEMTVTLGQFTANGGGECSFGPLWAEDDAVIVYSDAEKSGVRYVVKTIKSSTVAVLKLESETSAALGDGPYYIAWPASAKPSYSGSKVTFSTVSVQQGRDGKPLRSSLFAAGCSKSTDVTVYPLCSVVNIGLYGKETVSSIVLSAGTSGVSGKIEASFDEAGKPVVKNALTKSSSIVLNTGETVLGETPTNFAVVIPAADYTSGMEFMIKTAGEYMLPVKMDALNAESGVSYDAGHFDVTAEEPAPDPADEKGNEGYGHHTGEWK